MAAMEGLAGQFDDAVDQSQQPLAVQDIESDDCGELQQSVGDLKLGVPKDGLDVESGGDDTDDLFAGPERKTPVPDNRQLRLDSIAAAEQCSHALSSEKQLEDMGKTREALLRTLDPTVAKAMTEIQVETTAEALDPAVFADAEEQESNGGLQSDTADEHENDSDDDDNDEEPHSGEDEDDPCIGICDGLPDPNPRACLRRAKEQYSLDVLELCKQSDLDFLDRIRLLNFLRKAFATHRQGSAQPNGDTVTITGNVKNEVQALLENRNHEVWTNDSWLVPVVPGDAIIPHLETNE